MLLRMVKALSHGRPRFLSIVAKGANKRSWRAFKADDCEELTTGRRVLDRREIAELRARGVSGALARVEARADPLHRRRQPTTVAERLLADGVSPDHVRLRSRVGSIAAARMSRASASATMNPTTTTTRTPMPAVSASRDASTTKHSCVPTRRGARREETRCIAPTRPLVDTRRHVPTARELHAQDQRRALGGPLPRALACT
jgi:hypothetical protein